jgi:hypothetical protein
MLNKKRITLTIIFSILFIYIFSIAFAAISQRQFYADGAHFFLSFLRFKTFMMHEPSRQYALYFSEFPIVFCLRVFKLENVNILSYIFGLGLYLPQIISLLICFHIVRNINIRYMLFPILSLFGITQNIFFNMVFEGTVITCVFWPVLFYIIFVKKYDFVDSILLITMALIFMRSYPSAFVLGFILLTILLIEIYQNWRTFDVKTKLIWGVLVSILVNSIIIAILEIIRPTDPKNKADFLRDILTVFDNYQAMLSAIYILTISISLMAKRFAASLYFKLIVILLLLITIYLSILPLIKPELVKPWVQHTARSFHLYMIPLLCLIAYIVFKGIIHVSESSWKKAFILCAFLVVGQLTWQILMTVQWNGFHRVFQEELLNHQGYVRFEDTRLVNKKIGNQLVKDMTWGWTNPSLSILWSKNSDIKTIIANPMKCYWEPFDPRNIKKLPGIEKYGFTYDKYIERVNSRNQI